MGFLKRLFGTTPASEPVAEPINEAAAPEAAASDTVFETLRDNGVRAMNANQMAVAVENLRAAVECQPDNEQAHSLLVEALLRSGEFAEALPMLDELLAAHPDNRQLLSAKVQAAEAAEEWEVMHAACLALMELQPESEGVQFALAKAQFGRGDALQAVVTLTQILAANDRAVPVLIFRARVLTQMGQLAEAEADCDAALALDPEGEEATAMKADFRLAAGDDAAAEALLLKLIAIDPFETSCILKLAASYVRAKALDKAIALLDDAAETLPDQAEVFKARGGVRRMLGDEAGALDDLKHALELDPAVADGISGAFFSEEPKRTATGFRKV